MEPADNMDGVTRSLVLFRIGSEEYGLGIERVLSIIRYEPATPVPRAPEGVLGVINLRGRVVPVIDLMSRLSVGGFVPGPTSRIVVTESEAGVVGLAVDAASEVASVPVESIMPAPDSVLTADTSGVFEGVVERDGSLVVLLDLDRAVPKTQYVRFTEDTDLEGGTDV